MFTPRVLGLVTQYQLASVAATAALVLWLWPAGTAGVLAGGCFAALNFWGLRWLVERTVRASTKRKLLWGLVLAFKMVLALALMAALLLLLRLHPLAFALGLATLFIGIGLATAHVMLTHKAPAA